MGKVIVRPDDEWDWLEDRYEPSRWMPPVLRVEERELEAGGLAHG